MRGLGWVGLVKMGWVWYEGAGLGRVGEGGVGVV